MRVYTCCIKNEIREFNRNALFIVKKALRVHLFRFELSLFVTRQLISYMCKETTKETLNSFFFFPPMHWRNPNNPTSVGTNWPPYTSDSEEYLGLGPTLTVRSKMRPDKMAFWNELVPSIEETIKPTGTSYIPTTTEQRDDKKGVSTWNLTIVFVVLSGQRWVWEGN